jgi:hypothetical protein
MTAELKTLVEHCLCRVAAQLAAQAAAADHALMTYAGPGGGGGRPHRLLELGLWLSYNSVAEPGMIFTLLEQLMEGAVLSDCQEIFRCVPRETPWGGRAAEGGASVETGRRSVGVQGRSTGHRPVVHVGGTHVPRPETQPSLPHTP